MVKIEGKKSKNVGLVNREQREGNVEAGTVNTGIRTSEEEI